MSCSVERLYTVAGQQGCQSGAPEDAKNGRIYKAVYMVKLLAIRRIPSPPRQHYIFYQPSIHAPKPLVLFVYEREAYLKSSRGFGFTSKVLIPTQWPE